MNDFWKTIKIWSQKQHVVNKRLVGISVLHNWKCPSAFSSRKNVFDLAASLRGLSENEIIKHAQHLEWQEDSHWTFIDPSSNSCLVSLRKCLPKQPQRYNPVLELEVIDFKKQSVVYTPLCHSSNQTDDYLTPPCGYTVSLDDESITIEADGIGADWIMRQVQPKLNKWLGEMDGGESEGQESLRLVSLEAYNNLYHELKEKYVPELMKVWPECTDPQKFIHEDVAIAAYLILIWREEQENHNLQKPQSFLDIGCGNGLLVFLLASEGYPGKGIDIRARKLWALYPDNIHLEVLTLTPTESTSFPEYDWLLGNHSDELTPWIASMAMQSSVVRSQDPSNDPARLGTRYWVLPCCPFSFWRKFQRRSNQSRYQEYLDYVSEIGTVCGYQVEKDRMRIPSTRRTCFVGRTTPGRDWNSARHSALQLIRAESAAGGGLVFEARPAQEPVRNCTRVDRTVLDKIIGVTVNRLLGSGSAADGGWNKGGTVRIKDLVAGIDPDDLRALKSECGGIQTLLKNHSHIFVVQDQCVRFRSPQELSPAEWKAASRGGRRNKKARLDFTDAKTRTCWFFKNHPDGCPLSQTNSCRYLHQQ